MDEFQNPARKYKWFRPNQAARGFASVSATNKATVSLFNNSKGRNFLVVRDVRPWIADASLDLAVSYNNGQVGTSAGTAQPLVPSMPAPAGQVFAIDTATAYNEDYSLISAAWLPGIWPHDFPFAVLEPGWSLVIQSTNNGLTLLCSFVWEAIEADQLDWFW